MTFYFNTIRLFKQLRNEETGRDLNDVQPIVKVFGKRRVFTQCLLPDLTGNTFLMAGFPLSGIGQVEFIAKYLSAPPVESAAGALVHTFIPGHKWTISTGSSNSYKYQHTVLLFKKLFSTG